MEISLDEGFSAASQFMRKAPVKLDNEKKLKLYGLFKQGTEGDCHTSKPGLLDMTGRAKWTAWNGLKGLSKDDAKQQYVDYVSALVPAWENTEISAEAAEAAAVQAEASPFGAPSVSTMAIEDEGVKKSDAEKTIMELVADSNMPRVQDMLTRDRASAAATDDKGMSALHWACDRGNGEIVSLLLEHGADVNLQDSDGQTPLHYVVSCDHVGLVAILAAKGASGKIEDVDGDTAAAGADSKEMRAALGAAGFA